MKKYDKVLPNITLGTHFAQPTPDSIVVARLLGVPAVHPSHVGAFTMETMMVPGLPWPSICVGETTICDADGVVLWRGGAGAPELERLIRERLK